MYLLSYLFISNNFSNIHFIYFHFYYQSHVNEPYFAKAVVGMFVRVLAGEIQGQAVYRMAEVCMYVCMCMYECMNVCVYVCIHGIMIRRNHHLSAPFRHM